MPRFPGSSLRFPLRAKVPHRLTHSSIHSTYHSASFIPPPTPHTAASHSFPHQLHVPQQPEQMSTWSNAHPMPQPHPPHCRRMLSPLIKVEEKKVLCVLKAGEVSPQGRSDSSSPPAKGPVSTKDKGSLFQERLCSQLCTLTPVSPPHLELPHELDAPPSSLLLFVLIHDVASVWIEMPPLLPPRRTAICSVRNIRTHVKCALRRAALKDRMRRC